MHTELLQVSVFVHGRVKTTETSQAYANIQFFFKRKPAFRVESPSGVGAGITAMPFKHQFINNLQKRFQSEAGFPVRRLLCSSPWVIP